MKRLLILSLFSTLYITAGDYYAKAKACCSSSNFEKRFVGIEMGATSIKADTGDHGVNYTAHSMSLGLRLGAQTNAWRSMVVFDVHSSDDNDQSYERLMIGVDYFIQSDELLKYDIRPYIGMNGGYLNYESTGIDQSGVTVGGQIGAVMKLTNNFGLDASYRYNIAKPDALDSIGAFVLGVDYSF